MQNIAVIIGISEYKTNPRLPACINDAANMRRLLNTTGKYSDICFIDTNTSASSVKEALRAFFTKYKSTDEIDEVFFYFSGHGIYNTDAYFCCSDFDLGRPASTSLVNAEIDDLLRSVSPRVAVKIIDACESGSPYIKDASHGFEKALRESHLSSFICMASCKSDQSSYASADCSFFTNNFIAATLSKNDGTIFYRDIHAALADAFVATPEQTPFFTIQGTGLEVFSNVTQDMKIFAAERSKPHPIAAAQHSIQDIIAEQISKEDALYVSAESANRSIEQAGADLDRAEIKNPLVKQFYDKRVSHTGKLTALPDIQAVADFAKEQGWAKKYFVRIEQEQYHVRVPRNTFLGFAALGLSQRQLDDSHYTQETRWRSKHLEATQPLSFEVAEVIYEPKGHSSLRAFALYIGIVHSLTEIVILSAVVRFIPVGWKDRSMESSQVQWQYQSILWKDVTSNPDLIWKEPLERGEETLKQYLESFIPKIVEKNDAEQTPSVKQTE